MGILTRFRLRLLRQWSVDRAAVESEGIASYGKRNAFIDWLQRDF